METSDKKEFMQRLAETLASYGKALPEGSILIAWWSNLARYPMTVVQAAFRSYLDENGEFAPVPAGIAMRCKKLDGRPEAEEAWAIALTGQDEACTVVWTQETAEAFNICRPVLLSGNAISARMSFLEAYTRLVIESRAAHRPMKMLVSPGWDEHHRATVLKRAVESGLLPAPYATALLTGPAHDSTPSPLALAQLAKIMKLLDDAAEQKVLTRLAEVEIQRLAHDDFNRSTEEQVQKYMAAINNMKNI